MYVALNSLQHQIYDSEQLSAFTVKKGRKKRTRVSMYLFQPKKFLHLSSG